MNSPVRQQQERSGVPPKRVLSNSESERLVLHFPNNHNNNNKHCSLQLGRGGATEKALDLGDVEVKGISDEQANLTVSEGFERLDSWESSAPAVSHAEHNAQHKETQRKFDTNGTVDHQRDERRPSKASPPISPSSYTACPESPKKLVTTMPPRPPANKLICD